MAVQGACLVETDSAVLDMVVDHGPAVYLLDEDYLVENFAYSFLLMLELLKSERIGVSEIAQNLVYFLA